jgi:hypothetical protein
MGMLEEVRGLRVDFEGVVIAEEVQVESPSDTQSVYEPTTAVLPVVVENLVVGDAAAQREEHLLARRGYCQQAV